MRTGRTLAALVFLLALTIRPQNQSPSFGYIGVPYQPLCERVHAPGPLI